MATPNVNIINVTRTKISDEPGYDVCTVTFTCDKLFKVWKARANGANSGHDVGLLVGTNEDELFGFSEQFGVVETGSEGFDNGKFYEEILSSTEISFEVLDEELTQGDKTYTVSVYAKDLEGVWSG